MVTVFTPVYNRADIITQLYRSLLGQTDFNFEWLIVDDGSEDEISKVVDSWIDKKEAPFAIRFYQQKNGGKHRAINRGVQLAKGEAFFIVDSDDYITKDAVRLIREWWRGISRDDYAGISGLKGNKFGGILGGEPLFDTFIDATNIEREKYGLLGDKAEVYKTSVLKRYPFPEFEGENFLTEAVVWDKIAYDGLKIRWFREVLTICEYRRDGLTSQGKHMFMKNPKGWGKYIEQTCQYYHLSFGDKIHKYLDYYLEMKGNLKEQEIKENLQIDEAIFTEIKETHKRHLNETADKIGKRIAVYGIGSRGRSVLKLYEKTEIEVCFILDRGRSDLPYRQIGLEEAYPPVDAMIVTPKYGQAEIINFLKGRTKNRIIGYDEWEVLIFGKEDKAEK